MTLAKTAPVERRPGTLGQSRRDRRSRFSISSPETVSGLRSGPHEFREEEDGARDQCRSPGGSMASSARHMNKEATLSVLEAKSYRVRGSGPAPAGAAFQSPGRQTSERSGAGCNLAVVEGGLPVVARGREGAGRPLRRGLSPVRGRSGRCCLARSPRSRWFAGLEPRAEDLAAGVIPSGSWILPIGEPVGYVAAETERFVASAPPRARGMRRSPSRAGPGRSSCRWQSG